ncbi:9989_t:CDS:2, partial [Scutellospora calospora]
QFPERLQHILTSSKPSLDTESIVYPQYETRGDLKKAVELFCEWLEKIVKEREDIISSPDRKGNIWICLIGHSMGGILAADTILKYASQECPTAPKIIGLFAFDTPYYGVHENVFSKAALERVGSVAQQVSSTFTLLSTAATASGILSSTAAKNATSTTASNSSFGFSKWGLAALAGAALVSGAVYMQKDNVGKGVEWLGSHLEYVGVLWKKDELKQSDAFSLLRTFIHLPPPEMLPYFSSTTCDSKDEIDAHIYMFDPEHNHYYFDLGHVSAKRIIDT